MAQSPSHLCPRCGTSVPDGQQFCSNCGATQSKIVYEPTALSESKSNNPSSQTPPPPPDPYSGQAQPISRGQPIQQPQQGYIAPAAPVAPLPAYARPQKDSTGKVLGSIGCGVLSVILVILLVLGGVGYLLFRLIDGAINSAGNAPITGTNTNGSGSGSGNPNTQPPITTTLLNLTVPYAEIMTTIVDTKLSQNFIDDTSTSGAKVLRLDLNEHNIATASAAGYIYSDVAHLLLPGGQSIALGNAKVGSSPQKQTSQTNWLDFAVPANIDVSQAILELGTPSQAKMDIPLKVGADISKYQPKTTSPNAILHYAGINWTITSATLSYNADATQAATGMRYLTLILKADNPSSQAHRGVLSDFMRLKAGSATSPPESDSSFPTSVEANTTGTTGNVIFIVPEGTTAFTFVLLADANFPATQATADFSVQ